jgi:hypothetical protein
MQAGDLQYLLDYTIWADGKVLDGARHISEEQLGASHPMRSRENGFCCKKWKGQLWLRLVIEVES